MILTEATFTSTPPPSAFDRVQEFEVQFPHLGTFDVRAMVTAFRGLSTAVKDNPEFIGGATLDELLPDFINAISNAGRDFLFVVIDRPTERIFRFSTTNGVGDDETGDLMWATACLLVIPQLFAASGAQSITIRSY